MNQKGFVPVILIVLISLILVGALAYNLGKQSNKPVPVQPKQVNDTEPVITAIQTPEDSDSWVQYNIRTQNFNWNFKLPSNLAEKYGTLTWRETVGKRGSQLKINFIKDPESLIITTQSPEYIELGDSVIATFLGFKYENGAYYGLLPLGRQQEFPASSVTQYRIAGRDLIKVKTLYSSQRGMGALSMPVNNSPKIWGIINGASNSIYPGFTVQGTLDKELTESAFEQILSTFSNW